jgi:ABC-type multidrug transport system ATPase subunit
LQIQCHDIGKRFNREWIFRNLTFELHSGEKMLISGGNGSGKSTLLRCIAGYSDISKGTFKYSFQDKELTSENLYAHLAYAAPYLEVFEEMTLDELLRFHTRFKKMLVKIDSSNMEQLFQLSNIKDKPIKNFSSGMKQRVKTGLAILSDTPLLLLDEPLSNMDKKGADWYRQMITEYTHGRTIIVCSNNQQEESFFCNKNIDIEDYKKANS